MRRKQSKLPPNQVVGGDSFFKPKIQPKLAMGKPGDKYEVEADRMADQVVNKTGGGDAVQKMEGEEEVQQKPLAASVTPLVQKMESSEEEAPVQAMKEEEPVQAMEKKEPVQTMEEEEPVQAMEEEESVQAMEEVQTKKANTPSTNSNIEGKLRKGSGGSKMDANTQAEMESGFGADFSNINIHDDSEAAQMSQNIGAQAFTHGNDVYFNDGKYNPDSKEGKHLLAHELTHTIQQKGMVQKKIQKIGIDNVREQMVDRKFVIVEDYFKVKKGTVIVIKDWKENKGDAYGYYVDSKSTKIYTMIPKKVLTPEHKASSKIKKYEVGLSGQKNTLDKSQQKIDEWKSKEASYVKNKELWKSELKRLEDLHKKREKTMSQMLVRESMYNRFDDSIIKWVEFYNDKFKPTTRLKNDIVKSIIYQETRMGTSGIHLEKGPYKYDTNPHPLKSIYNLGQVIDSYGPQQFLMIKEMAPSIYKKYNFKTYEKEAKWKGMDNEAWGKAKIFDAIKDFSTKKDVARKNLMGNKKDLLLTYDFWIRATVRWLFEKFFIKKDWDKAVKAYNGSGKAADTYKKEVLARVNAKESTLKVGNK